MSVDQLPKINPVVSLHQIHLIYNNDNFTVPNGPAVVITPITDKYSLY